LFFVFFTIFIGTIALSLSSYFLYPLFIWVAGKILPFQHHKSDIQPFVSVIIPAYNEGKDIEKKIVNTLDLEYANGKVEILIGSDGSNDETASIVMKYKDQNVCLFDFKENRGKTAVQNDLVDQSKGEILIFTDAASFLPPDALKKIVRNFADSTIGCVAGRMRFVNTDSSMTAQSQGIYWRYELKIRELESRLGSLIGVDGPLYAVRRNCYIPLGHNIISDLITPLLVLEQGKKVVLEPKALVDEDPTSRAEQEFTTRRRITLRGLSGISTHKSLLNIFKHPMLSIQLFFHKVLRWFVGPLVILNGLSCLGLMEHWFFTYYFSLYVLFFIAAAIGWGAESVGIKFKVFTVPYYFSLVNFAATMGIIDYLRKRQAVTWKPVRN